MGASTLFPSLFRYKAKANDDLFAAVGALDAPGLDDSLRAAIRVLNHVHVVDCIFQAHLTGTRHGLTATNTEETPTLPALRDAVMATDQWYINYTSNLGPADLHQALCFLFTDGKQGRMSREEILAHVITHGAYHRGAVGKILDQQSIARPPDGLTNYLHSAEPDRRALAQS